MSSVALVLLNTYVHVSFDPVPPSFSVGFCGGNMLEFGNRPGEEGCRRHPCMQLDTQGSSAPS